MDELKEVDVTVDANQNMKIIELKKEKELNKMIDCELKLCYMDKHYDTSSNSIQYYKNLKKKISVFKKEVYSKLTAEDKDIIMLLDTYTQKLINQSIKHNIDEMKDILKQKTKIDI